MNASLSRSEGQRETAAAARSGEGDGRGALSFFTYTSGPLGGKMDSIFLSKKKKKKKSLSVWLSESQDWNTTGLLSPPQPQRLARPSPRPAASASPRFRGSAWGPGRRLSPGSRFPPRGFFSSAFLLFFFLVCVCFWNLSPSSVRPSTLPAAVADTPGPHSAAGSFGGTRASGCILASVAGTLTPCLALTRPFSPRSVRPLSLSPARWLKSLRLGGRRHLTPDPEQHSGTFPVPTFEPGLLCPPGGLKLALRLAPRWELSPALVLLHPARYLLPAV